MKGIAGLLFGVLLISRLGSAEARELYIHDPAIIESGGYHYLYSTGSGLAVYRSRDLESWERLGPVLDPPPVWVSETVPGFIDRL